LRGSTSFGSVLPDAGEGLRVTSLGVAQNSVQQALNGLLGVGSDPGGVGRVCHEEPELQQGGEQDMGVVLDKPVSDATRVCVSLSSEADQSESMLSVDGQPLGPANRRRGIGEDDPSYGWVLDEIEPSCASGARCLTTRSRSAAASSTGADEQLPVARGDRIAGRRATLRGALLARPRAHSASTGPRRPEFVPGRLCQRPEPRPNTPVPPVASRRTPPRTRCSITSWSPGAFGWSHEPTRSARKSSQVRRPTA